MVTEPNKQTADDPLDRERNELSLSSALIPAAIAFAIVYLLLYMVLESTGVMGLLWVTGVAVVFPWLFGIPFWGAVVVSVIVFLITLAMRMRQADD